MSKLYSALLNLSKIDKEKIFKLDQTGNLYLNLDIWINEEPDKFDNIGSINISQKKEEREAKEKKCYLTSKFKLVEFTKAESKPVERHELENDLPF
jgi:hypothetical protein